MIKTFSKILPFAAGLAVLAFANFSAPPAQADGYWRGGQHHGPARVHRRGPPKWAPAHGYRRNWHGHRPRTVVVYRRPSVVFRSSSFAIVIGGAVGRSMAHHDYLLVNRVLETGPTGHRYDWHNPTNGLQYAVTPIQTYYAATGQPCREYAVSGLIGVRHEQIVGTACRQSDGSWRTVN